MKEVNWLSKIEADLFEVYRCFPLESLSHVSANRHRLMRGKYSEGGRGCLMYLLSEPLDERYRITSKSSLMKFFTGRTEGADQDEIYAPSKWLVRWVDGEQVARYGNFPFSWEIVLRCLEQAIAERAAHAARVIETDEHFSSRVSQTSRLTLSETGAGLVSL